MASTYNPLATTTLSSAASTVTFSTISGSYTDLVLISSIKSNTANQSSLLFSCNGVETGGLYSGTMIYGTGSSAGSNRTSNQDYGTIFRNIGLSPTSTTTQVFISQFMNYSNTTTFKTVLHRSSVADSGLEANVSLYRSTSAITSIRVFAGTNDFGIGSMFTLYGISAA